MGFAWAEVQRLFAALDASRPAGVRDRAILMLFAIYGLRESEVAKLRLDDIDWEHDQLRIARAKRREAQVYPLVASVGNAIIDYLRAVRRSSPYRELFLTLVAPYRPLSASGLCNALIADRTACVMLARRVWSPRDCHSKRLVIILDTAAARLRAFMQRWIWPACEKWQLLTWESCHETSRSG
jgi:integrase